MSHRRLVTAALLALGVATAIGFVLGPGWGLAAGLLQAGCLAIVVLCAPRGGSRKYPDATTASHAHARGAGTRSAPSTPSHQRHAPASCECGPSVQAFAERPTTASHERMDVQAPKPTSPRATEQEGVRDDDCREPSPTPDEAVGATTVPDEETLVDQETVPEPQEGSDSSDEEECPPCDAGTVPGSVASPEPEAESFSIADFAQDVLTSATPLKVLYEFCERVGDDDAASPFERFLARRLGEADVATLATEEDFPLRVALPHHSGAFYLKELQNPSFGQHIQVLKIEAALNAARFAFEYYDDLASVSEEEVMRLEQRHATSVCGQVPNVETSDWSYLAMPWQASWGPTQNGEWAVRSSLAQAIEELDVPYRLEASFRSNVAQGDVAIEVQATHARVFPTTAFVDGLGIVPTTSSMRTREASKYAARMGILIANCAFRTSNRIRRVWLASIHTTPSERSCQYWACFDRRQFSHVRMDALGDPIDCLARLGATLALEDNALRPVTQGFYLEDQRFCPPVRHDLWKMSERMLPPSAALSLGTSRVSGLSIHEELMRILVSEEVMRDLPDSNEEHAIEKSVRSVLHAAEKTSDIDVWHAAERVASKLVDGTLSPDDPLALQRELVAGDELSRAVEHAQWLLLQGRPDEALEHLDMALRQCDGEGAYQDTASVVYRSFDSFAQRALYNRLNAKDKRCLVLVPDAYVIAHLAMSAILQARAQAEEGPFGQQALRHAERALEVAPLSTNAHLSAIFCLEHAGDLKKAESALRDMLEVAHDPQGIGLAYYRMASIQWKLGHHVACRACYQLAAGVSPSLIPIILAECHALLDQDPSMATSLDGKEVEQALKDRSIPLAPTSRMSFLIYDCASASIDAEVFPLARDLMSILESFTGDDVIHGIRASLESEPDQ